MPLQELNQRKQEMIFELKQYAEQATRASKGDKATGLVDKDTRVTARLEHSTDDKCLYLALEASHDALIKCAVVFADRLFEGGESVAVHVKTPEASLRVPLRPPRDIAAELQVRPLSCISRASPWHLPCISPTDPHPRRLSRPSLIRSPTAEISLQVRAIVGNRAAQTYHVFELKHELTKFSMFTPVESASITAPAAGVTCVLPGAGKKVCAQTRGPLTLLPLGHVPCLPHPTSPWPRAMPSSSYFPLATCRALLILLPLGHVPCPPHPTSPWLRAVPSSSYFPLATCRALLTPLPWVPRVRCDNGSRPPSIWGGRSRRASRTARA